MLQRALSLWSLVMIVTTMVRGEVYDTSMFTETDGYMFTGACTKLVVAANGQVFCGVKGGSVVMYPSMEQNAVNAAVTIWTNDAGMTTTWNDRGLLGLAVDPAYPTSPFIYVLISVNAVPATPNVRVLTDPNVCAGNDGGAIDGSCDSGARLLRIRVTNNVGVVDQVLVDDWCANGGSHHLGNIEFARDGGLFVSAGDGSSYTVQDRGNPNNKCYRQGDTRPQGAWRAQHDDYVHGKLLYIAPADLVGSRMLTLQSGLRICAKGLRNPFRWMIHPVTFDIYEGDVGQDDREEINLIPDPIKHTEVSNFGWPCFEGDLAQKWYGGDAGCDALPASAGKPWFVYNRVTGFPGTPGASQHCMTGSVSPAGFTMQATQAWGSAMQYRLIWTDSSMECIFIMANDAKGFPDPDQSKMKLISYNPNVPHPVSATPAKLNKWVDLLINNDVLYAVNYDQSQVAAFTYVGSKAIDPSIVTPAPGSSGGTTSAAITQTAKIIAAAAAVLIAAAAFA